MKIVAKTDVGMVRESNQDSYTTGELPNGVAWAVVCDGMGGAAGGNVASSTAVKVIAEQITSSFRPGMSAKSIKNMMVSAINAANISVYDISCSNSELYGMGTTVVCAIVMEHIAYISHQSYIFKGTVRDNLLMASPKAADEDMWNVLKRVNLYDFIKEQGGLDMKLNEQASNL